MKISPAHLFLALLASGNLAAQSIPDPSYVYFSHGISGKNGRAPACTPWMMESNEKSVILKDPTGLWGKAGIHKQFWDSNPKYTSLEDCVFGAPAYKDRVTPEMLDYFKKGQLMAGFPLEFATMILGPGEKKPGVLSVLNQKTGKPENYSTYVWLRKNSKQEGLRAIFQVIGIVALSTAATTNSIDTTITALNTASLASASDLVAWDLSIVNKAQTITIQATDDGKIMMFSAQ
jgi:hypothetical protein